MNTASYCSILLRLLKKGSLIMTAAVGLSMSGCAGDSENMDEPVQEEGAAGEDGGEGEVQIMAEEGESPEGNTASEDPSEPVGELTASESPPPSSEGESFEGSAGEPQAEDSSTDVTAQIISEPEQTESTGDAGDVQTAAVSPDPDSSGDSSYTDSSSDTIDAELTTGVAGGFESEPTSNTNVAALTPGQAWSVSSPGAAKFIQSKSESGYEESGSGGSHTYVVLPGDSLSGIARKIYGSYGQWKSLAAANGIKKPYHIFPGDQLRFDASNAKAKKFAQSKHGKSGTIKVKRGDTLSGIAEKLYGSAFSWKVIYAMNKDKINNPNMIAEGMVLAYADGGTASTKQSAPAVKSQKSKKSKLKSKAAPITPDQLESEDM